MMPATGGLLPTNLSIAWSAFGSADRQRIKVWLARGQRAARMSGWERTSSLRAMLLPSSKISAWFDHGNETLQPHFFVDITPMCAKHGESSWIISPEEFEYRRLCRFRTGQSSNESYFSTPSRIKSGLPSWLPFGATEFPKL